MQNSSVGSPNIRTLEVLAANNEQGRCIDRGDDSPGDPGDIQWYGVGNPPDLVSGKTPSLVNR
jgi:hypothetical protein